MKTTEIKKAFFQKRPKNIKAIYHSSPPGKLKIFYWGSRPHKWIAETLSKTNGEFSKGIDVEWNDNGHISKCHYGIGENGIAWGIIDGRMKIFNVIRIVKQLLRI